MHRETVASEVKVLSLAMVNHGRAHVLGMNLVRTEEEIKSQVLKLSLMLGRPLCQTDLFVGGADFPPWPMIPAMVRHGCDNAFGRDTAISEAELLRQVNEFSVSVGRPVNDGDFSWLICEFVTWILSLP